MLDLVALLHSRRLAHGDLKPNHFLMGQGAQRDVLFLIDFVRSRGPEQAGLPLALSSPPADSIDQEFGALNGGTGYREDLESLCYIAVYLLKGSLPWSLRSAAPPQCPAVLQSMKLQNKENVFI